MSESDARTKEAVEAVAAERGQVVRYPAPNELFVDIDDEASLLRFRDLLIMLTEKLDADVSEDGMDLVLHLPHTIAPSPSGELGHYHAVVTLPRPVVSEMERCLLQALLGSDPKREMLSWNRSDAEVVTCFFELPEVSGGS